MLKFFEYILVILFEIELFKKKFNTRKFFVKNKYKRTKKKG